MGSKIAFLNACRLRSNSVHNTVSVKCIPELLDTLLWDNHLVNHDVVRNRSQHIIYLHVTPQTLILVVRNASVFDNKPSSAEDCTVRTVALRDTDCIWARKVDYKECRSVILEVLSVDNRLAEDILVLDYLVADTYLDNKVDNMETVNRLQVDS